MTTKLVRLERELEDANEELQYRLRVRRNFQYLVMLLGVIAFAFTTISVWFDLGWGGGSASFVSLLFYAVSQVGYVVVFTDESEMNDLPKRRKNVRRIEREIQDLLLSGEAHALPTPPDPPKPMLKKKRVNLNYEDY